MKLQKLNPEMKAKMKAFAISLQKLNLNGYYEVIDPESQVNDISRSSSQEDYNMPELIIDKKSAEIIDKLVSKAINTTNGRITNWGKPYGISFRELSLIGDRIKYGDEFVRKRELEKEREQMLYETGRNDYE